MLNAIAALILLTLLDGTPVWINSEQIIYMRDTAQGCAMKLDSQHEALAIVVQETCSRALP